MQIQISFSRMQYGNMEQPTGSATDGSHMMIQWHSKTEYNAYITGTALLVQLAQCLV